MKKNKILKHIFFGTLLSILIFFSISFLTILTQINPIHYYEKYEAYKLDIGLPFVYYKQFFLRGNDQVPNSNWYPDKLFIDCLLTWISVLLSYLIIKRK